MDSRAAIQDRESTAVVSKVPLLSLMKNQRTVPHHPVEQLAKRCERLRNQLERVRSSLDEETVSENGEQPDADWDKENRELALRCREHVDLLSLPTIRARLHGAWGCPGFKHDPVERYRLYAEEWKKFPIPGEKKHQSLLWDLRVFPPFPDECTEISASMSDVPCEPFVLSRMIENWRSRKWTVSSVPGLLEDYVFGVRMGLRSYDEPGKVLYETLCPKTRVSAKQFQAWCSGFKDEKEVGELSKFPKEDYWAYLDYNYMFDCFECSHLDDVDWNTFGIAQSGRESTFWMGTAGSFTACHYDTYGFNIVAQLCGKKRWVLFPPEDSPLLKGSHLPFEESSVYSGCDMFHPPIQLRSSHPRVVTLEPGDVLFVPPRWWHFVQCIEDSISVNCWIAVASDRVSRMDEAVTRACMSVLKPLVNDNMMIEKEINTDNALKILTLCAVNSSSGIGPTDTSLLLFLDRFACRGSAIPQVTYDELCKVFYHSGCTLKHGHELKQIEVDDILATILCPSVIEQIRKELFRPYA
uniref:JmjC domain-containing protein n=1 Tax=Trichuris muris TaxID=70415 RepID=A0A5S6Q880_TRIMR